MNAKVSIIIPIFNSALTLPRCLDSVLSSSYNNLEVLLLDDGSVDESLSICKEYAEKDARIRVFHHENHGVSYTRNRGLDEATGDYVMFVDADDTISSEWVGAYVKAIEENVADMAIGSMTEIDVTGKGYVKKIIVSGVFGQEIWIDICKGNIDGFGYVPNKIYSIGLINNVRFDEQMTVQEDTDFAIKAIEKAKRIAILNESGYYYYYTPNKRETPYIGLLKNQIQMWNNLMNVDKTDFELLNNQIKRVCELVELSVFQATEKESWKDEYEKIRGIVIRDDFHTYANEKIVRMIALKKYDKIYKRTKRKLYVKKVKEKVKNVCRR